VTAARQQKTSAGAIDSDFLEWLAARQEKGFYPEYNPDTEFERLERRMAAGESFSLAE
jgi:hypothetical protein